MAWLNLDLSVGTAERESTYRSQYFLDMKNGWKSRYSYSRRIRCGQPGRSLAGQGRRHDRRRGFYRRDSAGLVVSTGILGDLVLPAGAFDPGAERLSGISCGGGHIGI